MAIVKMSKLSLIGLNAERETLLTALSRSKCVEVINMETFEDTIKTTDMSVRDELAHKMTAITNAFDFIKYAANIKNSYYKKAKIKSIVKVKTSGSKFDVKFEDLMSSVEDEYNLFGKIIDKTAIAKQRLVEIESEVATLRTIISSMRYFTELDVKFSSLTSTVSTFVLYGLIDNVKQEVLSQLIFNNEYAQFVCIQKVGNTHSVVAMCHNDDKEELVKALSSVNFVTCSYNYDSTASAKIDETSNLIEQLEKEYEHIVDATLTYNEYIPQLKVLYDYYSFNYQLKSTDDSICSTTSAYLMQCWVPEREQKRIEEIVKKNASAYEMNFEEVGEQDNPPIITKNNKFVAPHESITDMYSVPNYRESDPNWAVSIFFFLFMGVILGDAGYGLLLAIGAFVAVKLLKPQGEFRNLLIVFGFGGVSTVFWGILFGGWFGIETSGTIFQPILFSPLGNPMGVIGICLALGVVQVMVGIGIKAAALIREKKVWDAIFDCLSWELFFISIILLAVGGLLFPMKILVDIGMIGMLVSMIIVALTNGRKSKGIFGKAVGGFVGVYNVINYLSDVLSYLRLFGLCLAGGVIAMVFNLVAGLFLGNILSAPLGVVILLIGHSLNLALSLLGVYVHDSRLQHIEFFSKFYAGEGVRFKPLASETKYILTNN